MGFRAEERNRLAVLLPVSIPKRGFGGFSQPTPEAYIAHIVVSIPKRGFGGFSPGGADCPDRSGSFQSLRGVLVGFRRGIGGIISAMDPPVSIPKRGFGGFSRKSGCCGSR